MTPEEIGKQTARRLAGHPATTVREAAQAIDGDALHEAALDAAQETSRNPDATNEDIVRSYWDAVMAADNAMEAESRRLRGPSTHS